MTPIPHSTTTTKLANRHGGKTALPVTEGFAGVFASAWVMTHDEERLLRKHKNVAITLVIDTNVPGHPSVSMKVQPVQLTPG